MAGISAILFDQQFPGFRFNPVRMDFATLISTPPHFLVVRVAVLQEFPELLPVVVLQGTVAEACAAFSVPNEAEDVPASLVSHFPLTIRHIQEVEHIGVAVKMVFPYDPICGFVVFCVLFLRVAVCQIGRSLKKPKYPISNSYFGLAAVIVMPIAFLSSLFRTGPVLVYYCISFKHLVIDISSMTECHIYLVALLIIRIDSHFNCPIENHALPPFNHLLRKPHFT